MTSNRVIINDVSPRDGLQNQPKILTSVERLELIKGLLAAGVNHIEVGSFVSPKAVPAMAGTDEVVAALSAEAANFSALIPNQKGYDLAKSAGVKNVALVMAASEEMNLKNTRMTTQQSLDVCMTLSEQARQDGLKAQVYLATAWECPFEGLMDQSLVEGLAAQLASVNPDEIVLADTIGAANPAQVSRLMTALIDAHSAQAFSCHFHDTRGFGVANVYAAVQAGVRKFDASVGGLGGCPFAPGASGNVATEDVVLMLEKMGYDTGIDLKALVAAADLAEKLTGVATGGNASKWLKRQIEKGEL